MRHGCWMTHQRLHTSKAFGQSEYFEAAYQLNDIGICALILERNHAAESTHLTLCKLMIGMRGQSRKVYLLNFCVLSKKFRYSSSILFMLTHAHSKRFNAAQC